MEMPEGYVQVTPEALQRKLYFLLEKLQGFHQTLEP